MSSAYRVEVRGLDAMRRALRALGPEFSVALRLAHRDIANRIVAPAAAREAPRRSGTLAGDVRGLATQNAARVAVGRAAVPYANPIHWGWPRRNIAPNPFLQRAAELSRSRVQAEYEAAVSRSLSAVGFH